MGLFGLLSAIMSSNPLSAFVCDEKKNQKYVHDINAVSVPHGASQWSDSFCRIALTIVSILLALTVGGAGNDICTVLFVC